MFDPRDQRKNLFDVDVTTNFDNAYGNVHISRLAEMSLTRAECNFRLSSAVGATPLADINRIRNRVGLPKFVNRYSS